MVLPVPEFARLAKQLFIKKRIVSYERGMADSPA